MQKIIDRIEFLREEIRKNSKLYYENDAPAISDYEYDMMFRELCELEEKYPELKSPDSPTHRVGGKALDKFEKVTHGVRMDSLTDVFSFDELRTFTARVRGELPIIAHQCVFPLLRSYRHQTDWRQCLR